MAYSRVWAHVAESQSQPSQDWSAISSIPQTIWYYLYTIWLLTLPSLYTIIIPSTAFAVLHTLGNSSVDVHFQQQQYLTFGVQAVTVIAWTWINSLPIAIGSQRRVTEIKDDRLNQPGHLLPKGRLATHEATRLLFLVYLAAILVGFLCGTYIQSVVLVILGVCYNDLGGSNMSWLVRNFINGFTFISLNSGALQIMLGQPNTDSVASKYWLFISGCIVLTTVQIQDLPDRAGYHLRGRSTMTPQPVTGDKITRISVAVPVLSWSCFGPYFWQLPSWAFTPPLVLGLAITYRLSVYRNIHQDQRTVRLWSAWIIILYSLPLLHRVCFSLKGTST